MILHTYYQDSNKNTVYLSEMDSSNVFYILGKDLVHSTIEFFTSKYKLIK